mmetsp:Transcript_16158/g.56386  ORF Transcript_16158/g.56386 Transcript_16158/m.56386 type:complete len:503 (-) Transcript_16158:2808-4316(-)
MVTRGSSNASCHSRCHMLTAHSLPTALLTRRNTVVATAPTSSGNEMTAARPERPLRMRRKEAREPVKRTSPAPASIMPSWSPKSVNTNEKTPTRQKKKPTTKFVTEGRRPSVISRATDSIPSGSLMSPATFAAFVVVRRLIRRRRLLLLPTSSLPAASAGRSSSIAKSRPTKSAPPSPGVGYALLSPAPPLLSPSRPLRCDGGSIGLPSSSALPSSPSKLCRTARPGGPPPPRGDRRLRGFPPSLSSDVTDDTADARRCDADGAATSVVACCAAPDASTPSDTCLLAHPNRAASSSSPSPSSTSLSDSSRSASRPGPSSASSAARARLADSPTATFASTSTLTGSEPRGTRRLAMKLPMPVPPAATVAAPPPSPSSPDMSAPAPHALLLPLAASTGVTWLACLVAFAFSSALMSQPLFTADERVRASRTARSLSRTECDLMLLMARHMLGKIASEGIMTSAESTATVICESMCEPRTPMKTADAAMAPRHDPMSVVMRCGRV